MSTQQIIDDAARHVADSIGSVDPGHDWWHVQRVWNFARYIGKKEGANLFIVQLAALFHDLADYKFHDGDESIGPRRAAEWLVSRGVAKQVAEEVAIIIRNMNFKGPAQDETRLSLNHAVVQDADRLDAIGAIGVARAFSFGGFFGRTFHDPSIRPALNISSDEYRKRKGTVINHFHEKLLLLKDRMMTETGRQLAVERATFLEGFLEQFLEEWRMNFEEL